MAHNIYSIYLQYPIASGQHQAVQQGEERMGKEREFFNVSFCIPHCSCQMSYSRIVNSIATHLQFHVMVSSPYWLHPKFNCNKNTSGLYLIQRVIYPAYYSTVYRGSICIHVARCPAVPLTSHSRQVVWNKLVFCDFRHKTRLSDVAVAYHYHLLVTGLAHSTSLDP